MKFLPILYFPISIYADYLNLLTDLNELNSFCINSSTEECTAWAGIDPKGPALMKMADRSLINTDMQLISEYGCWCYFESEHGHGRGKPIDQIDSMCKVLHDGYMCAMMDSEEFNLSEPCVPWEVSYNSAFGGGIPGGLTIETLGQECDLVNDLNSCANWACKIEGWFVQSFFLFSLGGGSIDQSKIRTNGFDVETECPIQHGIKSDHACCNKYPIRFPFKAYNGIRQCCGSKTFDSTMLSCCDDGKTRINCN